jgi:methanethiol S-methyltransferase
MTSETHRAAAAVKPSGSAAGRYAALFYGIASYGFSVITLLYTIGFVENLVVPKSIDGETVTSASEAVLVNVLLITIFALQHSLMARSQFKACWTQVVPKAIERSTYVLFTSLCLALLLWQWRPIPSVVWHVENETIATALIGLSLFGWITVFASTFLINHFELFGLHQVANNLTGKPMPSPRFYTPLLYKLVRHPLYLGLIIAFWATPTMTVGHLLFAAANTAYILIGILFEERDLTRLFGDDYRRYKQSVSMLLPWRKSPRRR